VWWRSWKNNEEFSSVKLYLGGSVGVTGEWGAHQNQKSNHRSGLIKSERVRGGKWGELVKGSVEGYVVSLSIKLGTRRRPMSFQRRGNAGPRTSCDYSPKKKESRGYGVFPTSNQERFSSNSSGGQLKANRRKS